MMRWARARKIGSRSGLSASLRCVVMRFCSGALLAMKASSSTASSGVDGIVMNPAAYTHTSVAILDALKATAIPTVEVHISDVSTREAFRHHSYVSLAAKHTIIGHGIDGYREGIEWLAREPKSREIHTNSFPCL